jgi:hypothetical protein
MEAELRTILHKMPNFAVVIELKMKMYSHHQRSWTIAQIDEATSCPAVAVNDDMVELRVLMIL